jgi:hypothetical protein
MLDNEFGKLCGSTKNGLIYFHQGWTDIINCLPLVNYYSLKYDKIYLFIRKDSEELIDFFCKQLSNIEIIYIEKKDFEYRQIIDIFQEYNLSGEHLIHGQADNYRQDEYSNSFFTRYQEEHFADRFYKCYNLDRDKIIQHFDIVRDGEAEEEIYRNFVLNNGKDYKLCHKTNEKILENTNDCINLDAITNNFFLYIKVLENAKELHLVDSSWASFCYLLDKRFNLFREKNILIYLYPFNRHGGLMPSKDKFVEYKNWILK